MQEASQTPGSSSVQEDNAPGASVHGALQAVSAEATCSCGLSLLVVIVHCSAPNAWMFLHYPILLQPQRLAAHGISGKALCQWHQHLGSKADKRSSQQQYYMLHVVLFWWHH